MTQKTASAIWFWRFSKNQLGLIAGLAGLLMLAIPLEAQDPTSIGVSFHVRARNVRPIFQNLEATEKQVSQDLERLFQSELRIWNFSGSQESEMTPRLDVDLQYDQARNALVIEMNLVASAIQENCQKEPAGPWMADFLQPGDLDINGGIPRDPARYPGRVLTVVKDHLLRDNIDAIRQKLTCRVPVVKDFTVLPKARLGVLAIDYKKYCTDFADSDTLFKLESNESNGRQQKLNSRSSGAPRLYSLDRKSFAGIEVRVTDAEKLLLDLKPIQVWMMQYHPYTQDCTANRRLAVASTR